MMKGKPILACLVFLLTLVLVKTAWCVPFSVKTSTPVYAGPAVTAPTIDQLSTGSIVDVDYEAGGYWRVHTQKNKTGFVPVPTLTLVKTKGLALVPIIIAAAAPVAKAVLGKMAKWFLKKTGMDAGGELLPGQEFQVLSKEPGGWIKVLLPDGTNGFVKDSKDIVYLKPVTYADNQAAGMWKNSEAIPANSAALALEVLVRKTDGTPVPSGATLKLGDSYKIFIKPTADCYIRITCETPDHQSACQYYPNQFQGTQTSSLFKAGYTYSAELLPPGIDFKVNTPIGKMDILRIEATSAKPFSYVPANDGCAPTVKFKGGGFSVSTTTVNPTPQVVVEYIIKTVL